MPKIPARILNCVFYLYHSAENALAGEKFGGTGFFIGVPIADNAFLAFGVTNWHVAVQTGASVIRVNRKDGRADTFALDPSEWDFVPGGNDLAIAYIPQLNPNEHDVNIVALDMIADQQRIQEDSINAGEDVFLIGRFVDHDGGPTNVPSVRFGNVSVMPQPIKQPTGSLEPSYVLDVHSRTGYSGSPVFVYRTVGADLGSHSVSLGPGDQFLHLLGIHWGQFPERWDIEDAGRDTVTNAAMLSADAKYVVGLSGMTLAIPAPAIRELLNMPRIRTIIEEAKRGMAKMRADGQLPPRAEAAPATEENPRHKEDFTALLGAAAKSKPQAD